MVPNSLYRPTALLLMRAHEGLVKSNVLYSAQEASCDTYSILGEHTGEIDRE